MTFANQWLDNVVVLTATTGTGTMTLGATPSSSPPTNAQTEVSAGATNGATLTYRIDDGTAWEIGYGVYGSGGRTLTRTPIWSSNSNALISLDGAGIVRIVQIAEDITEIDQTYVIGQGPMRIKDAANNLIAIFEPGASGGGGSSTDAAVLQGTQNIRRSKSRLLALQNPTQWTAQGGSGKPQFKFALASDSWGDLFGPQYFLYNYFKNRFAVNGLATGIAAPGYVRFSGNAPALGDTVALTFTGFGTIVTPPAVVVTPNCSGVQSSTVNDNVHVAYTAPATVGSVNYNATAVVLYAPITGNGVVQYRWNGGSYTTLTLSSQANLWTALGSVPTGSWTLDIQVVSGTVTLGGVDIQTAAPGVVLHAIGKGGQRIADILALAASDYESMITNLNPLCISGFWGTNDRAEVGMTAALFASQYGTLVGRWQTAVTAIDIIVTTSPYNGTNDTSPPLLADLNALAKTTLLGLGCAYWDCQILWGDPNVYKFGGTAPLLNSLSHPNQDGQPLIGSALIAALTEQSE